MTSTMTGPGSLRIEGLSASYGARKVIKGLTLAPLPAGEITALVGPNAAGKSTLLRALAGLVRTEGSIRLDDLELSTLSLVERSRRVGFMPQALPQGVELSVLESVLSALHATGMQDPVGGVASRERALRVLERLGLVDLALEPLSRLSGGQKQLASLAQALVREPQILLLDEPTSALDLRHQVLVMSAARTLAREGRIVVVVLHDLNLAARWADRLVVLDRGARRAEGLAADTLSAALLAEVYGVRGRVERCSQGHLQISVDGSLG